MYRIGSCKLGGVLHFVNIERLLQFYSHLLDLKLHGISSTIVNVIIN